MIVKQVRISEKDKDRLSKLKGKTGISNWNVLCRWAICFSLSEPTIPQEQETQPESNVEMSWSTFGGDYGEVYEFLVKERCYMDGLGTDPETVAKYFKLHLSRGIAYLSGTNVIHSIEDLYSLAAVGLNKNSLDTLKGSL